MGTIRVGTCGFRMRQAEYYRTFPVIELQQTFYRPPQRGTAERWRREAPEGFEFALKVFQAITHPPSSPTYRRSGLSAAQRAQCGGFRDTPLVRDAWRTILGLARVLEARRVVFQCPASFQPTDENVANLSRFFEWADRGDLDFGWEPRGQGWTDDVVGEICRDLSLIHVVDPFERRPAHGELRYFRLHGIGGYRHEFNDQELRRLLEFCDTPNAYCLFNNVTMRDDASRFLQIVGWEGRNPKEGAPT